MADYLNIAGRIRTTASDGVSMEAQEVKDLNLNKSQQEVNSDVQTELGDRYTKEETYSKEQLDDLITTPDVNYVSVVATNATTAVTDILPATGEANTIYRVGNWNGTQYDPTMYALFAWNGTTYVCLAVRSFVGEVYDISANHPDGQGNPTPYADLAAALGTDGANIPADIRRGGMSIKFIQGTVQSSDHKYVQFRCKTQTFSTNPEDWYFEDDDTLVENPLYIKAECDAGGHLLFWIKKDGSIDWAIGVPTPVKTYVDSCINEIREGSEETDIDGLNKIIAFLDNFSTSDTLASLLGNKVNKEEGKSLIDENVAESLSSSIGNKLYMDVETDAEGKILGGRKADGTKFENMPMETPTSKTESVENSLWMDVKTDKDGKIVEGINKKGEKIINVPTIIQGVNVKEFAETIEENISAAHQEIDEVQNEIDNLDLGHTQYDKSVGNVSAQDSPLSQKEASSITSNTSIMEDEYLTDNVVSRIPKPLGTRLVAINHDDFNILDLVSQRKLLNKYYFNSTFSYKLDVFGSIQAKELFIKNSKKLIEDGNSVILHVVLNQTSYLINPLFEVKPDKKTNFVPTLSELKPVSGTNMSELDRWVDNNTTFDTYFNVIPSALNKKIMEASEEDYFKVFSYISLWNGVSSVQTISGLDLDDNYAVKGILEWVEYWYYNLVDNSLGLSTYSGTVSERYAADYDVPVGGSVIEYYPDGSHIKNGKIKLYSEIGATTAYTWYAWKYFNAGKATVIYTRSENVSVGDSVYIDTSLTLADFTVASVGQDSITSGGSDNKEYARFESLDITNHLDANGYQAVGVFNKGLFKGCSTSMNIEVLDRLIAVARAYFKHLVGTDKFDGYTPHGGTRAEKCAWYDKSGEYPVSFYDREHYYAEDFSSKVFSTRLMCNRSAYDVFENNGFKHIVHDGYAVNKKKNREGDVYLYQGQGNIRKSHLYNGMPAISTLVFPNLFYSPSAVLPTTLSEIEDVFSDVDNIGRYLIDNALKTVEGKSGTEYKISDHHRMVIERIISCLGTGQIPQLSFDTIVNSSGMKMCMELLYQFCYNNDIDIVSHEQARRIMVNSKKEYLNNYFPNPLFRQTLKNYYNTSSDRANVPDGFSIISFDDSESSMSVESEIINDATHNVLNIENTELNTRVYGLVPGTYKFKCLAKVSAGSTIKLSVRKNKDFHVDEAGETISATSSWGVIEKTFVINEPVVIKDSTLDAQLFDGYQNNDLCVLISLNAESGNISIANPEIINI